MALRMLTILLATLAAVPLGGGPSTSASAPASYWRVFASSHPEPLFYQASAVAVGGSGNVFIADMGDHRVKKFSPAGKLLASWGTDTPGPAHFAGPSAVAVDSWGTIYVADGGIVKLSPLGRPVARWGGGALQDTVGIAVDRQRRVDVVSLHRVRFSTLADVMTVTQLAPSGKVLSTRSFPYRQTAEGVLEAAIATNPAGDVLVSVAAQRHCHDCDGTYYQVWQLTGNAKSPTVTSAPIGGMGIAVDATGGIYLARPGGVGAYSPAAGTEAAFGSAGCGTAQFGPDLRLAAGPGGILYAADNQIAEIGPATIPAPFRAGVLHVLSTGGTPVALYGRCPAAGSPKLFGQMAGLARTSGGRIYVSDVGYGTVRIVGAGGTPDGTVTSGHSPFVAVDAAGSVYSEDLGTETLRKLSPAGKVLAEGRNAAFEDITFSRSGQIYGIRGDGLVQVIAPLSGAGPVRVLRQWRLKGYTAHGGGMNPSGIALGGQGNVYVADTRFDHVQVFTSAGRFLRVWGGKQGSAPGLFKRPSRIAVDAREHVYVVDAGNSRVQEFNAGGRLLRVLGRRGQGLGQFIDPVDAVTDGRGNLYVADNGNDRIVELVNP